VLKIIKATWLHTWLAVSIVILFKWLQAQFSPQLTAEQPDAINFHTELLFNNENVSDYWNEMNGKKQTITDMIIDHYAYQKILQDRNPVMI